VEVEGLDAINWAAPWLSPIAIDGLKLAAQEQWRDELNRLALERNVRGAGGHPIRFCRADAAGGEPYETFVARTGCVPTRANLHDYFNALMYLRFPRAKATLNALHASAISRDGITSTRGSARDAATLIDENALLLVTQRADLIEALRRHDWTALFVEQRSAWNADIRTLAFGHALLDTFPRRDDAQRHQEHALTELERQQHRQPSPLFDHPPRDVRRGLHRPRPLLARADTVRARRQRLARRRPLERAQQFLGIIDLGRRRFGGGFEGFGGVVDVAHATSLLRVRAV